MAARMAMAMVATVWCLGPAVAQDAAPSSLEITEKLNEGKRFWNEKKWNEARAAFEEILKLDPKNFQAAWWMAQSHIGEANPNAAKPWFAKASDNDPTHFMAAAETGLTYRRYQEWAQALPYLQRAVAALGTGNGFDDQDAAAQAARELFVRAGVAECFLELGKDGDAEGAAQAVIKAGKPCPMAHYILGRLCEKQGDTAGAIAHYKQGGAAHLDEPIRKFAHHFAVDDHRGECQELARVLEEETPKYGERKGDKFIDAEKEFSVDLPPKSKEWTYLYPAHQTEPGKVESHIIHIARRAGRSSHNVLIIVSGGANSNTVTMDGKTVKIVETEAYAEAWRKAMLDQYVEIAEDKPVKKTVFFNGTKGFYFSYNGKEKATVARVQQMRAEGQQPAEPPMWETHNWVMKGKKFSFWIHVKCQGDAWKKNQKEIQGMILRSFKFPS